jgi:hypothetical protein
MLGAEVCCKIRRSFGMDNLERGKVGDLPLNIIKYRLDLRTALPPVFPQRHQFLRVGFQYNMISCSFWYNSDAIPKSFSLCQKRRADGI